MTILLNFKPLQTVVRGEDGNMYDSYGRMVQEGGANNGPNGIAPSAAARMASSAVVRSNSLRSTSPPRYLDILTTIDTLLVFDFCGSLLMTS